MKDKKYDLREESLANHGWCLYASAGEGEQRDAARLKRAMESFRTLEKEFPKSPFLDRAMFYSGEAAYGLQQAGEAIEFYDKLLSMPEAKESPLRCDASVRPAVLPMRISTSLRKHSHLINNC